jgi:hypothetical protein
MLTILLSFLLTFLSLNFASAQNDHFEPKLMKDKKVKRVIITAPSKKYYKEIYEFDKNGFILNIKLGNTKNMLLVDSFQYKKEGEYLIQYKYRTGQLLSFVKLRISEGFIIEKRFYEKDSILFSEEFQYDGLGRISSKTETGYCKSLSPEECFSATKTIYSYDENGMREEEMSRETKHPDFPKKSFPSVQTVKYVVRKDGMLRKAYLSDELSMSEFYDQRNLLSWTILHKEARRKKNGKTKFRKVHHKKIYNYEYWND